MRVYIGQLTTENVVFAQSQINCITKLTLTSSLSGKMLNLFLCLTEHHAIRYNCAVF